MIQQLVCLKKKTAPIVFNIHPNPSNGIINLEIKNPQSEKYLIEIFVQTGQKVYSQAINNIDSFTINCQHIKSGIYFLVVTSSGGIKATQKLVIVN